MARGMTMAAASSPLLLLALLIVAAASSSAAAGTVVGGRRDIKDVGSNKEVQSLGLFAVAEHNRLLRLRHGAAADNDPVPVLLSFTAVASAQEQVVSGKAYYLKVIAREDRKGAGGGGGGGDRPFDAVVVIRAWLRSSRELVSFTPSPK